MIEKNKVSSNRKSQTKRNSTNNNNNNKAPKLNNNKNSLVLRNMPVRRWEPKEIQIKTLEGEFSVTMWSHGEFSNF